MKSMRTLSVLVIIGVILLSSCGLGDSLEDARTLAESFLDDRFVSGGIGSEEFYSDLFWRYTRAEDWEYIKNMVTTHLGELQSYMLKSWKVQSKANMGDLSGTIVVLIYDTEYEYGSGQEKITLLKRTWDSDFQIIGHYFDNKIFA